VADDDEMLTLLSESGCVELLIGFESITPETLHNLEPWKAKQLADYPRVIEKIQDRGIGVVGLFVLGFDHDTEDTFPALFDFISRNGLYDIDLSILTPIPGSRLYQQLKEEGRLLSQDWYRYNWHHVNFMPKNLTPKELKEGVNWVYGKFYSPEEVRIRETRFKEILGRLSAFGLAR